MQVKSLIFLILVSLIFTSVLLNNVKLSKGADDQILFSCETQMDMVILLDGTGSRQDFEIEKKFTEDIIQRIADLDKTRISIQIFGKDANFIATMREDLNSTQISARLQESTNNNFQKNSRNTYFSQYQGILEFQQNFRNVPKIMITITHGEPTNDMFLNQLNENELYKNQISAYFLIVGKVNETKMLPMVGNSKNVLKIKNYKSLLTLYSDYLSERVCNDAEKQLVQINKQREEENERRRSEEEISETQKKEEIARQRIEEERKEQQRAEDLERQTIEFERIKKSQDVEDFYPIQGTYRTNFTSDGMQAIVFKIFEVGQVKYFETGNQISRIQSEYDGANELVKITFQDFWENPIWNSTQQLAVNVYDPNFIQGFYDNQTYSIVETSDLEHLVKCSLPVNYYFMYDVKVALNALQNEQPSPSPKAKSAQQIWGDDNAYQISATLPQTGYSLNGNLISYVNQTQKVFFVSQPITTPIISSRTLTGSCHAYNQKCTTTNGQKTCKNTTCKSYNYYTQNYISSYSHEYTNQTYPYQNYTSGLYAYC